MEIKEFLFAKCVHWKWLMTIQGTHKIFGSGSGSSVTKWKYQQQQQQRKSNKKREHINKNIYRTRWKCVGKKCGEEHSIQQHYTPYPHPHPHHPVFFLLSEKFVENQTFVNAAFKMTFKPISHSLCHFQYFNASCLLAMWECFAR